MTILISYTRKEFKHSVHAESEFRHETDRLAAEVGLTPSWKLNTARVAIASPVELKAQHGREEGTRLYPGPQAALHGIFSQEEYEVTGK